MGIHPKLLAAASKQPKVCYFCEETFYRSSGKGRDAGKCCSRKCGHAWQAISRRDGRVSFRVRRDKCSHCGKRMDAPNGQNVCSSGCKSERKRQAYAACRALLPAPSFKVKCPICNVEHTATSARTKYCSKPCAKKAHRLAETASGTRQAHRQARKLRLRCAQVEVVNPLYILKRDNWRCQICGVKTPQRLRGSYNDRAPEVDHILPIAKGGEHSTRNCQCACRACNLAKTDNPKGQTLLFG